MVRLNKYIAECGVCSRREADKLIEHGRVLINGKKAINGAQVQEGDVVELNGRQILPLNSKVVLAYNKPIGITCTEKDKHADKTIIDAIKYPVRLTYAGRLDKESDGLIIMTNDGELIQKMMKASNFHEKEYIVKVDKELTQEFIDKMKLGVYLKELNQTTRECKVRMIGKYTFQIVLTQGLNRQIRRMCESLGYKVKSLTRIRVMNIELADLKSGKYREINGTERELLYKMCGLKP